MSFESFEEIIQFAIEKEKEAAAFYEDASSHEPYAGGKEIFKGFGQEERKHQALLEGFLKGEKTVSDYILEWIPALFGRPKACNEARRKITGAIQCPEKKDK